MKFLCIFLCIFIFTPAYSAEPQDMLKSGLSDYDIGFFNKAKRARISKKYLLQAKTTFENIIAQYPDTSEAQISLFKIGFCYYKLRDFPNAIENLSLYTEKYSTDNQYYIDDAKHQLGLAYKLFKDDIKAEMNFKSVIAYKNESEVKLKNLIPESYFELWQLYKRNNNTSEAALIYNEFLTSYPEHPKAKYMVSINK